MYHRWAALALVLALWCMAPESAAGQSAPADQLQPRGRKAGTLGQNYPNPFNPETFIPFSLTCDGAGGPRVVTLQIYNVLAQQVAIPILQAGTGTATQPAGAAGPLVNVRLACGQYTAFWDGKYLNSSREVASGIYLARLEIDGKPYVRKMIVMK